VRLETAGGIANVRDILHDEPFLVYNGDILTDLPLAPLIEEHQRSGNIVTLALRSHGPALHIAYDAAGQRITDIRNKLETGDEGTHLFTGIYACSPAIHEWLTPGKVESVIPIFLEMIRRGVKVGAVVLDEGQWWDLGSRTQYLAAHAALNGMHGPAIHPEAHVAPDAVLRRTNVIGPGATVEPGCWLEDCILWPHAKVVTGARLTRCIVRSHITAAGTFEDVDF
jgi:NDP-sugar pyrophosphorylase family protein